MRCPDCGGELQLKAKSGLGVRWCPSCLTTWFILKLRKTESNMEEMGMKLTANLTFEASSKRELSSIREELLKSASQYSCDIQIEIFDQGKVIETTSQSIRGIPHRDFVEDIIDVIDLLEVRENGTKLLAEKIGGEK